MPGDDAGQQAGGGTTLHPTESGVVVDSDVDLRDPGRRRETRPRQWDLVVAAAVGGMVGAEARYGVDRALPAHAAQFPWSTVIINVSGSLLIGVVMVILLDLTSPHRLARPFLGVGVLGGYTTYSTFAVDTHRLILAHRPLVAMGYVLVSLLGCLLAVLLSSVATRAAGAAIIRRRLPRPDPARSR